MTDPEIKDHTITIILTHEDFRQSMGRKAKDQQEFDNWAHFAEKGVLNGQIDWDTIYECTREAMERQYGGGDGNGA